FLDTPIDECIRRISGRGNDVELFEHKEFLQKVKENYERIFAELEEGVTLVRIDGLLPKEEIARQIREILFTE
ncbi:MAG: deoxynucleoside kinase, partial [Spirochaetales bacterium]|nr:deoxynucleoside kinase [Spirochaetales bacterium]